MGGRCASLRWHAAGQMRDDHIHFTRDGGDRIGRMLFADLMRGAEKTR
jgi:lysophospholipase L1-like esterase